jgi:hypothetical protein
MFLHRQKGGNMAYAYFKVLAVLSFVVLGALAVNASQPYSGQVVYCVDIKNLSTEERVIAVALEGLANRTSPRCYLRGLNGVYGESDWRTSPPLLDHTGKSLLDTAYSKFLYPQDVLREYYAKTYGFVFKDVALSTAIDSLKKFALGIVKYASSTGNEFPFVELTAAGVKSAIPATSALITQYPALSTMPVALDISSVSLSSSTAAHTWEITNLLPSCSTTDALSCWQNEFVYLCGDMAVKNAMPVYRLDYSTQTALLDQILASLQPAAKIWGWGDPDEYTMVDYISKNGKALICATGLGLNGSFHMAVKPLKSTLVQMSVKTPATITLENKVYVCCAVNEGDTYKYLGSLFNGAWLMTNRGKSPVNWGVDPYLYLVMPALFEYFYDSATLNDYFFNATAGNGYFYPSSLPSNLWASYADVIKSCSQKIGTRYIDIWWFDPYSTTDAQWVKSTGMEGMTSWQGSIRIDYPAGGIPVIGSDLYYKLYWDTAGSPSQHTPSELANLIISRTQSAKLPYFVFEYAIDPYYAQQIDSLLPDNKYKVVTMDEFFSAAMVAHGWAGVKVAGPVKNAIPKIPEESVMRIVERKGFLPAVYAGTEALLDLYDIKGRFITTLAAKKEIYAGLKHIDLPDGIYMVRARKK